jgi:hypothetical protein
LSFNPLFFFSCSNHITDHLGNNLTFMIIIISQAANHRLHWWISDCMNQYWSFWFVEMEMEITR